MVRALAVQVRGLRLEATEHIASDEPPASDIDSHEFGGDRGDNEADEVAAKRRILLSSAMIWRLHATDHSAFRFVSCLHFVNDLLSKP